LTLVLLSETRSRRYSGSEPLLNELTEPVRIRSIQDLHLHATTKCASARISRRAGSGGTSALYSSRRSSPAVLHCAFCSYNSSPLGVPSDEAMGPARFVRRNRNSSCNALRAGRQEKVHRGRCAGPQSRTRPPNEPGWQVGGLYRRH